MNFVWLFKTVEPDLYAAYRDGEFQFNMTSKQILRDARFRRDHSELIRQLSDTREAVLEVGRGTLRQFSPFAG